MKAYLKLLTALIATLFIVCACASPVGVRSDGGRALSEIQRVYKSASLVVIGTCTQTHIDAEGRTCYDLVVEEIVAGDADIGDLIHCTEGSMKVGERYMLYLTEGEDAYHSEDMTGYCLLTDAPLKLNGAGINFSGEQLSIDAVKRDIAALDSVVVAPLTNYYYRKLSALVDAADEIFIGRAVRTPELSDTQFRAHENGTSVENTLPAAKVSLEVYGCIKGALNYGDSVELVYSPAMSADTVYADTLKAVPYGEEIAPRIAGGQVYLFFLVKSPDSKQGYRFCINPMQGFVELMGNELDVSFVNCALMGYSDLSHLVKVIREAL